MSLWFIILPIMSYFIGFNARPRPPLPFPHLTDFQLSDIEKPVHIFEGIDYDKLPEHLKIEYSSCYDDRNRCLRVQTHMNPVCGYIYNKRTFKSYVSICDLNLQNCLEMTDNDNKKFAKYGTNYWDRKIYYLGDGYKCEYYVRSLKEIMKVDNTTIVNATSV